MLTNNQIHALFQYFAQIGIPFYDVQNELVDHYASAIENLQEKEKDLSFNEAFKIIDKDFNQIGFPLIDKSNKFCTKIKRNHSIQSIVLDRSTFTSNKEIVVHFNQLSENYDSKKSIIDIVKQDEKILKKKSLQFQTKMIISLFQKPSGIFIIVGMILLTFYLLKLGSMNDKLETSIMLLGLLFIILKSIAYFKPLVPTNSDKISRWKQRFPTPKIPLLCFKKQTFYDISWPINFLFLIAIMIQLYSKQITKVTYAYQIFQISLCLVFLSEILSFVLYWKEGKYRFESAISSYPEVFAGHE